MKVLAVTSEWSSGVLHPDQKSDFHPHGWGCKAHGNSNLCRGINEMVRRRVG
jgi:hypothetical protein